MLHPHLRTYLFKYKGGLLAGTIAALVSTILNLAPAYYIKNIVDALQNRNLTNLSLVINSSGWLLSVILANVTLFYQRFWVIAASRHIEHDIRMDFYVSLQQQPHSFFDKYASGDLISAFTNDMERIRELMGPSILHGARGLFLIIATIAYMLFLSPILTAYIILPILLVPIVTPIMLIYMAKLYNKLQQALSNLTQITQETLTGVNIIKDYTVEENFIERFLKESKYIKKISIQTTNITALEWPFLEFVAGLALVVLLFFGGLKVVSGEVQIGELVALMMLLFKIRMPLIIMGWVISMIQRGRSAMHRFFKIYDQMQSTKVFTEVETNNTPSQINTVELKNVCYSYNEETEPILNNINMKWVKGQTIGIVGPVGSGKTTLALLVAGIYQSHGGEILINGEPAEKIPFAQRIKLFGWVPQDNFLFSTSIKENILLGQKDGDNDYEKYGDIAGLTPDIKGFANGYDSLLGERGINLSGGQKQRVSIARALISNAPILIFDDSFSSLDAKTEQILLKNLDQIRKDKINILISHRLSTLQSSDIIYVLIDGRISEQGTHEELMQFNGYYAMTYREQQTALEISS